jgi:hypothetical protein
MISAHNKPPTPPQWDWAETANKKTLSKFTESFVFKNYVQEAIKNATEKTLARKGK